MNEGKEIKFIDLFGGVGGFRLGLESVSDRFKCIAYYEIDKYAVQTYNKNFKEDHTPTDITKVPSDEIPDHDLLCAGFPCQAFSIAGKREGFKDTRGTLFFEICRILRDKRPEMVLLENVKGLLSHNNYRTFRVILESLRELGYVGSYQVLNSKDFGVPQNRERVFIFGARDRRGQKVFPVGESNQESGETSAKARGATTRFWDYPANTLSQRDYKGGNQLIQVILTQPRSPDRPSYKKAMKEGKPKPGGTGILTKFDETYCLDTLNTNSVVQNSKIRRLTPKECERLQGFPDNWTSGVSDTQRYKQMGNAVTVNVIEAIGRRVLEVIS